MSLTSVQQHLIGYFKLVHVSKSSETIQAYEKILREVSSNETSAPQNLKEDLDAINNVLRKYDMEIVETFDELSSEKLQVLINTGYTDQTQKVKFYDKNQTRLFSEIIRDCVISSEGFISETHCLNLSSNVGITKTTAQSILEKLLKEKWLLAVDGNISLGMRTITELKQSISKVYAEEVKHCPLCKILVVQGCNCKNCKSRYHFKCIEQYFKNSKSKNISCFNCKKNLNGLPFEGSIEFV